MSRIIGVLSETDHAVCRSVCPARVFHSGGTVLIWNISAVIVVGGKYVIIRVISFA